MSKTEKMNTYKRVVSIDLVLRNSFYLLLLGILAMLGIACLSSTVCAEESASSAQVQEYSSNAVQGDPFAVEGDSFDSLIEESPELSTLDEDDNKFALGGYLESRNQLSLVHFDEPISLRQRLRLEGGWKHKEFSAFVSTDTDLEAAAYTWEGENRAKSFELKECYLTYDTESLDMLIGRKIHRWGTGDGVNPLDLINPLDVRDPVAAGNADNRVPTFLMSTTYSVGAWSLEGVLLPRGSVNDQLHQGNPWPPKGLRDLYTLEDQGELNLEGRDVPDEWFSDMEFGGKLTATLGKIDLSFIAYSGFINSPLYKYDAGTAGVPSYTPVYPSFSAFGFNFASSLGDSSTLRGEFAYKPSYPVAIVEGDGIGRRDLWQGVLGVDYDYEGAYYLNIQFFADLFAGNLLGESGTVNSPRSRYGITYELSGKYFNDDLKAGVRGSAYASNDGTLTDIFSEYQFGDNWKLSSGVMIWTGDASGTMGQYDSNDTLYMTVRYSF